jgi:hypothetical protein
MKRLIGLLGASLLAWPIAAWTPPAGATPANCCKQDAIVKPAFDREILGGFEPSAKERRAQERGKVTVRIRDTSTATMKVVQSEGFVRAPARAVWNVILDYDAYPKLFHQMELSETVLKSGDWEHHYTVVRYPWPWGKRWTLNTIQHDTTRGIARFKRLEGSIKEVEGTWEVRELGASTALLRYGVRMDPGLEFIPTWVIPWATSIVVPDILMAVGKEAELRWLKSPKTDLPGGGGTDRTPRRPTKD